MKYASALLLAAAVAMPTMADDLWSNGSDTDGANGLSNATDVPFGFRRTVLDDFEVPAGETWDITGIRWLHLWNSFPPGSGTGLEILFRADNGGQPGAEITTLLNGSLTETATGRSWFGRAEVESESTFSTVSLGAGRYWFEATIVGPDNNFWMTAPVIGSPMWVNYADFGGLQPGFNIFGIDYDLYFVLTGNGGGGGVNLSLSGDCPGRITADVSGATPGGTVAYVFGVAQGSTTIPGGPCAGTQLGVQGGVRLIGTDGADGSGNSSLSGNAPGGACGRYLQALDVATCTTSNVAQIN